ncbi:MAG: Panacea domain-containing protein [Phycisphaerae bacterium]
MTPFPFSFTKTLQAVATLLRREKGQSMSYMRALKLLYIADRESLAETGRTISGDKVIAMKQGPVLSRLLDLIKGKDILAPKWDEYIEKEGYRITLAADPGNGMLCRYDIDKLEEVCARYREQDEWELVDITHTFPEWKKNHPGESSRPIPLQDILEAVGRSDQAEAIERDAKAARSLARLFGN